MEPCPRIAVIGAGLAGSLLCLALARRGASVLLLDPALGSTPGLNATALSYGGVVGRGPARHWRRLERSHGPLGWRRGGLVLHGRGWPFSMLPPSALALLASPLSFGRVDVRVLGTALPAALAAAGVERSTASVAAIAPRGRDGWSLRVQGESGLPATHEAGSRTHEAGSGEISADRVVLAAGAHCRSLWPTLPPRLGVSWAGVLALRRNPGGNPWLDQVRRGRIVMPARLGRPALEAQLPETSQGGWIVDAGLAPWGEEGVLLGQISLVRPSATGDRLEPPDPVRMEARLREGLGRLDPALACLEGAYRQVPVTFCVGGGQMAGPVQDGPGLWLFTGFSGAFSLVPAWAERMADALMDGRERVETGQAPS